MAVKTTFKRYNAARNEWDKISLWQQNAVKLHSHALSSTDYIVQHCGYGFQYCACGENIIGIGQNKYIIHTPIQGSVASDIDWSGTDPHLISNNEDTVIGCMYNSNKIFVYKVDEEEITNVNFITPSESENKYIGVQYVEGLWILISATNIYYTRNLDKGFNSIKYNNDANSYARIRYNPTVVCKYLDYYYIIGMGDYGETIRIQINAGNLTITKVYQNTFSNYYGTATIIPVVSKDGIGITPLIITMRSNNYITLWYGNSPMDIENFNSFQTDIYCTVQGKAAGFQSAKNKISLMYNYDGSQKLYTALIDLIDNSIINTGVNKTKYRNPEVWGFDCGTHFAAYSYTSGKDETNIHGCSNGIDWYQNWGYFYIENVDKTHSVVTSIFKQINSNSRQSAEGVYVGDGDGYDMPLAINFDPARVICCFKEKTKDVVEYNEKTIVFEDRNGETWSITSYNNVTPNDTYKHGGFTILIFDFLRNKVYAQLTHIEGGNTYMEDHVNKMVCIGDCEWDGERIITTLDTNMYYFALYSTSGTGIQRYRNLAPNVENGVYRWWAIK